MRYVIGFVVMLFMTVQTHAANWIRPEAWAAGSVQAFELKSSCEQSGFKCLEILPAWDLDSISILEKTEDDLEKPIWSAKENVQACADRVACITLASQPAFCPAGLQAFYADKGGGSFEAYCANVVGYAQKVVKYAAEDAAKKAAKQAKAQAAADKAGVKATRRDSLKTADVDNLSTADLKKLVKAIRDELLD